MAIDTAEKRRSAASFRRLPGVTPNASKDQEWRQQAARRYSGILAGEAEVSEPKYPGGMEFSREGLKSEFARDRLACTLERGGNNA